MQYREGDSGTDSGDWTDAAHTGTGTTATITGLSEDTSYQVQVQATNDEGTGAWSDSGVGSTSANAAAVLHLVVRPSAWMRTRRLWAR